MATPQRSAIAGSRTYQKRGSSCGDRCTDRRIRGPPLTFELEAGDRTRRRRSSRPVQGELQSARRAVRCHMQHRLVHPVPRRRVSSSTPLRSRGRGRGRHQEWSPADHSPASASFLQSHGASCCPQAFRPVQEADGSVRPPQTSGWPTCGGFASRLCHRDRDQPVTIVAALVKAPSPVASHPRLHASTSFTWWGSWLAAACSLTAGHVTVAAVAGRGVAAP